MCVCWAYTRTDTTAARGVWKRKLYERRRRPRKLNFAVFAERNSSSVMTQWGGRGTLKWPRVTQTTPSDSFSLEFFFVLPLLILLLLLFLSCLCISCRMLSKDTLLLFVFVLYTSYRDLVLKFVSLFFVSVKRSDSITDILKIPYRLLYMISVN